MSSAFKGCAASMRVCCTYVSCTRIYNKSITTEAMEIAYQVRIVDGAYRSLLAVWFEVLFMTARMCACPGRSVMSRTLRDLRRLSIRIASALVAVATRMDIFVSYFLLHAHIDVGSIMLILKGISRIDFEVYNRLSLEYHVCTILTASAYRVLTLPPTRLTVFPLSSSQ